MDRQEITSKYYLLRFSESFRQCATSKTITITINDLDDNISNNALTFADDTSVRKVNNDSDKQHL